MSRVKTPVLPSTAIDRPNRWRILVRRQRRRLRPVLLLATVCVVALGWVAVVGRGDDLGVRLGEIAGRFGLHVRQVVVEGRTKTPDLVLHKALAVQTGDSILAVDLAAARARIEAVQWVAHATVARRLPGTILVRLEERSPFAVWQHDGRFVLIDREGNVVTDSDVAAFAHELPLVVGAGAPEAAAGLIDALNQQPSLLPKVSAIVRVGGRRWNIRTTTGTDVLLPEGAEGAALKRLAQIQASDGVLDRPLAAIDMRLPDRLTLRPLADPAAAVLGHRPA